MTAAERCGRPLPAPQTLEARRAFDYLAGHPGGDPARIGVTGAGDGGMIALYTAALEPRIASVTAQEMMASFMTLARAASPGPDRVLDPGRAA